MVVRFLTLILALDKQNMRLELRQWPTATDRSLVGLGPEFSPKGFGSSTMRSGVPSASNSALNLYPWISVNFVKADSDKLTFLVKFSSGHGAYGCAFSFLSDAIKQSLWYIFP